MTTKTRDSVRVPALCCLIRRSDGAVDEVIGALALSEPELRAVVRVTPEYARRMLGADKERNEQTLFHGVCEVEMFEPLPESPRIETRVVGEPFGRAPLDLLAHHLDKIPAHWREFTLRRIQESN